MVLYRDDTQQPFLARDETNDIITYICTELGLVIFRFYRFFCHFICTVSTSKW